MERINLPEAQDEVSYWNSYVTIWINDKMVQIRSNFKEQCRKQYMGKAVHDMCDTNYTTDVFSFT